MAKDGQPWPSWPTMPIQTKPYQTIPKPNQKLLNDQKISQFSYKFDSIELNSCFILYPYT